PLPRRGPRWDRDRSRSAPRVRRAHHAPRRLGLPHPRDQRAPTRDARLVLMGELLAELRAGRAIARKHVVTMTRYRVAMISMIFIPLYQGVIPAFLFGAAFAVGGRSLGLASSIGTDNLAGFIFLGGVVSGMIATAFWGMAMSLRNEQDAGTLEPSWLTPSTHETFVIGRALGGSVLFLLTQVVLLGIGLAFLGLRLVIGIVRPGPPVLPALPSWDGFAYVPQA